MAEIRSGHDVEYWLPDVVTLRLTSLEAGALMMLLLIARQTGKVATFLVNRPGKKKATPMIEVLLEKLNTATAKLK